jgi:hypothetical protein
MRVQGRFASVWASAVLVLAVVVPVHAQGKSNGKGNGRKSSPPSSRSVAESDGGPSGWRLTAGVAR